MASEFIMKKKIGEILMEITDLSDIQLLIALGKQVADQRLIGELLIEEGFVTGEDVAKALSIQFDCQYSALEEFKIKEEMMSSVPATLIKMYYFIPLKIEENLLTIITYDPTNLTMIDNIRILTGFSTEMIVASKDKINKLLNDFYFTGGDFVEESEDEEGEEGDENNKNDDDENVEINMDEIIEDMAFEFGAQAEGDDHRVSDMAAAADSGPIVKLVNKIILDALASGCSDIHIECWPSIIQIRFRIDGTLFDMMNAPKNTAEAIVSRIKIMSDLNIAERRIPQDGAFSVMFKNKKVDFRVSILPSVLGENIVIRVLSKENVTLDIRSIGFEGRILEQFITSINKPYGMILITGPTGSGKTTTLYSALSELNNRETKIITVEDPVEFQLPGIHQTQVFHNKKDPARSLTFAAGLRSILRQDPDVVMLGEIRDEETAEIAVNAALTGHLVFSTVHANNAVDVVGRMKNMAVESDLLAAAVNIIIAQRLIRRICGTCKIKEEDLEFVSQKLAMCGLTHEGMDNVDFYKGKGCEGCRQSGYRGRIPIFEVLEATSKIKGMIIDGESSVRIREYAENEDKMLSLSGFCALRVKQGFSDLEELVSIARVD